ncbi:MAG: S1/P1 nuclease [Acidobacteriota bacterium]|nr:S1/P1 nuclease [Acidobacteriota bacterium]
MSTRGAIIVFMYRKARLIRPLLLFVAACAPASAWWCEGHEVIALIAENHLMPAAKTAVFDLLRNQPIDPALPRFCKDRPPDPMADASTWADDVKRIEQTAFWHFMDIPLGLKHGDPERYCHPVGPSMNGGERSGCILSALRYNLDIVRNGKESDFERAKALRYLIHLTGDLHQPLHTTADNDMGGNCVPIQFFSEPKPANLHGVWDGMILNRELATRDLNLAQYAQDLEQRFQDRAAEWTKRGVEFDKWAWEGHKIAQKTTYGDLHPKIPVEPYDPRANCKVEAQRFGALHFKVDDEYQAEAEPVVDEQIAKAAYRLAEMLNTIWPG